MKQAFFLLPVAALLAACSGIEQAAPLPSYNMNASIAQRDLNGWYTFGDTRFQGAIVNGAPDGDGRCVKGTQAPVACRFLLGRRVDADYIDALRAQLARDTAKTLESERRELEQQAAADREETRRHNASVQAGDRAILAGLAALNQNVSAGLAQSQAIGEETQRLRRVAIADKQAAADAVAENRRLVVEQQRELAREATERARASAASQAELLAEARAQDAEATRMAEREKADADRRRDEKRAELAQNDRRLAAERKRAQDKADRELQQQVERDAQAGADAAYLAQLHAGLKLRARTCPDGEGKYYLVGIRPKIKPERVGCVDVHFEAICAGSSQGVSGIAKNFVGAATDCFMGDAATIAPTPSCKVADVRVEARKVTACGR